MSRLIREPLVHFLLLGAALFVLFQFTGRDARAPGRPVIEITPGVLDHLKTTFARTWQRMPSEEEMTGLVRDYVRDELAYREGQALGLDRDDSIIRQRMRQKLEMLSEETSLLQEPDESVLAAYMQAQAAKYAVDPAVALVQVFVNPERHAQDLEATLQHLRDILRDDVRTAQAIEHLGDSTLLPTEVPLTPHWQLARDFGDAFADAVVALEPGMWSGPIRSTYGLHFVRVQERQVGRLPELSEVRDIVLRDWQAEAKQANLDGIYAELLTRYEVVFPDATVKPAAP